MTISTVWRQYLPCQAAAVRFTDVGQQVNNMTNVTRLWSDLTWPRSESDWNAKNLFTFSSAPSKMTGNCDPDWVTVYAQCEAAQINILMSCYWSCSSTRCRQIWTFPTVAKQPISNGNGTRQSVKGKKTESYSCRWNFRYRNIFFNVACPCLILRVSRRIKDVKAQLYLCLIKHQAMRMCGGNCKRWNTCIIIQWLQRFH
jgi:hypothetical protein